MFCTFFRQLVELWMEEQERAVRTAFCLSTRCSSILALRCSPAPRSSQTQSGIEDRTAKHLAIQDSKTFCYPAYQPSGIAKYFAILSLMEKLTIQDSKTFGFPIYQPSGTAKLLPIQDGKTFSYPG